MVLKTKERITIFCSEVGLRLLANAEKIGADGTFKSRPILYEQVYIIMAWMNGEKGSVCLPAAFVLLGGKHSKFKIVYFCHITFCKKYLIYEEETYIRMLDEIKKAVCDLGLRFNPKFVCLDFELGAIHAFVHCCW